MSFAQLLADPQLTVQPAPSPRAEIDRALQVLQAHKDEWARLPIAERIAIIDQLKESVRSIEERWVAAAMQAKGAQPGTLAEGEEWASIAMLHRSLNYLRRSLVGIQRHGLPSLPGKVWRRPNGQLVARVLPASLFERVALLGIQADIWMQPGAEDSDGGPVRGAFYQQESPPGQIALVLAAGNVASQVPGDFLAKLFVEGQVVALKTNPVNAYLGPLIEEGFAPLIERGYLQILHGRGEEGQYLAQHPDVDNIHLTGADRTYEAIVFGPGEMGRENKRRRTPIMTKPFSAELGNISPVIIVPGLWSRGDMRYQAAKIGTWQVFNAGHNCLTPRVYLTHRGWDQREEFNQALVNYLKAIPTRNAYYPGASDIHRDFLAAHPDAWRLGQPAAGQLPWTYITDVDPTNQDDICFTREGFCSLFAETALDAASPAEFIRRAVEFANQRLWGTLVASIVVHPKSLRDPAVKVAVNQAIEDLDYGSVVINQSGALPYYSHITPWGGAPGRDMYDIQSGVGFVNNPIMFDTPQKSVCYAPFRHVPDPYMAHSTTNYHYFRRDSRFQDQPTLGNLVKLLWAALRA